MALNEVPLKTKKKDWQLTGEAFERLLDQLDQDRERAAHRYEQLRVRLIKLFEWRGSLTPEEHADEVFNRLARKIAEGVEIRDVGHFLGGIARRVFLETVEQRDREQRMLNEINKPMIVEIRSEEIDPRLDCFRACLNALPLEHRRLIVDYYHEAELSRIEQRKTMADTLRIPLNALRIRAYRLRTQLDGCIRNCLKN